MDGNFKFDEKKICQLSIYKMKQKILSQAKFLIKSHCNQPLNPYSVTSVILTKKTLP